MTRPDDIDFPCSQDWRAFYSQSDTRYMSRQTETDAPVAFICTCRNCYHNLGEHCACRELSDMVFKDCPDWSERLWS